MTAVIKIVVSSSSSGSGIADVKRDIRDLDSAASSAGKGFLDFKGVGVAAFAAVGTAAAGALVGVAKFASDSVTAAGDFEGALQGFSAIAGDSLSEAGFSLEDVSQKALQLGQDTKFSAGEALGALTELAKGGVPVKDLMGDATQATLDLAAAASLDLAPAAEIVSKQLGVWGDTGVSATDVANLLSQAANASEVDVAGLGLALANAGGSAKVAGLGFQETIQSLALIAPNFSSAADAGTSFKTFVSRLIPTTDSATEAMAALGLATEDGKSKFFDATGSFIGMEQAAQLLQDATAGLSEEEKLLAFNTIFGADAIRAAAAIADAGGEQFRQMGVDMAGVGTAAEQAGLMNQGFGAAMQQLGGAVETLQIRIGTLLLPVLTDFVNNVLTPGVQKVIDFSAAFAAAPDKMGFITTKLQEIGPQVLTTLQGWATGAAQWILDAVPGFLQNAASFLTGMVNWVVASLPSWAAALQQLGFKAIEWIANALPGLGQNLGQFYNQMITWIVGTVLPNMVAQYQILMGRSIQWITDALPGLGANLGAFAGKLIAWLIQTIADVTPKLVEMGLKFIAWIATDVMPKLPGALLSIATGIYNFIMEVGRAVIPKLAEVGGKFVNWVQVDVLPHLPGALEAIKTAIGNWVSSTLSWVGGEAARIGGGIISGIAGGIRDAAGDLAQAAIDAVNDALAAAGDAIGFGSPAKAFIPLGLSMDQGMAIGLARGASLVEDAAGRAVPGIGIIAGPLLDIRDFIASHNTEILGILSNVWKMIPKVIRSALTLVANVVSTGLQEIVDAWLNSFEMLPGIIIGLAPKFSLVGHAIIDGMTQGVLSSMGSLIDAVRIAVLSAMDAAQGMTIGLPMAQGMALGLSQGAPMVASAGMSAYGGMSQTDARSYSRSFTYSPTIYNSGRHAEAMSYALAYSLSGV